MMWSMIVVADLKGVDKTVFMLSFASTLVADCEDERARKEIKHFKMCRYRDARIIERVPFFPSLSDIQHVLFMILLSNCYVARYLTASIFPETCECVEHLSDSSMDVEIYIFLALDRVIHRTQARDNEICCCSKASCCQRVNNCSDFKSQ